MLLNLLNAFSLIVLGLTGFTQWQHLGVSGPPQGTATEMMMPVFFGGAFLICLGFEKLAFRHGLYGGLIMAILGVVSSIMRIDQYGAFTTYNEPKTQIIIIMGGLCLFQGIIYWKRVQKDRKTPPVG